MAVTTYLVSAPGKVILSGEHAVVYDKAALAGSLGLRTYGIFSLNEEKNGEYHVRIRLPDLDVQEQWNMVHMRSWLTTLSDGSKTLDSLDDAEIHRMAEDSSRMIEIKHRDGLASVESSILGDTRRSALQAFLVVYKLLCMMEPHGTLANGTLDVCLRSTIPVGAGLGSSAAFSSCIAAGLLLLNKNVDLLDAADLEISLALINRVAYYSEIVLHGVASGLDNTLSTYGGLQLYSRHTSGSVLKSIKHLSPRFLLVDTMLAKNTGKQVQTVARLNQKYPLVIKSTMDAIHHISVRLSEAWNDNDLGKHVRLLNVNHNLLAALGVSHPSLDQIVHLANSHGFVGAKLTGAGGGGCAIVCLLVENGDHQPSEEAVKALEVCMRENGFECFNTQIGGSGVEAELIVEESLVYEDSSSKSNGLSPISAFYNIGDLRSWNGLTLRQAAEQLSKENSLRSVSITELYEN